MEKQEKAFILNKGLILGLVLMLFPIIDLLYGIDMSLINYSLIFGLFWMIIYSYLVVKWSKEYASYYEIFPFKDAFRTLFLISALGFATLTVGRIAIYNIAYPEKYIDLTESFYNKIISFQINLEESTNNSLFESGEINSDEYENQHNELQKMTQESRSKLKTEMDLMRKEGIGITFFIGELIYSLFFISIYCAILALLVRKKEKFIKIN